MINNDRIVPVTKIDLLSLYGTMLALTEGDSITTVDAEDPGTFALEEGDSGLYIANEPVKSFDFASFAESESTPEVTVFFVPAYDYEGFSIEGDAVETTGVEVVPDGYTLYVATCNTSAVGINKIGF